jgi:hypothetical protein
MSLKFLLRQKMRTRDISLKTRPIGPEDSSFDRARSGENQKIGWTLWELNPRLGEIRISSLFVETDATYPLTTSAVLRSEYHTVSSLEASTYCGVGQLLTP